MVRWRSLALGALLCAAACATFTEGASDDAGAGDAGPDARLESGAAPLDDASDPPSEGGAPKTCANFGLELVPAGWAQATSGGASLIAVNEGGQTYDQMTVASQGAVATLSRDLPIPADDTLGITVLLQVTASPQSTSGNAKIVTVSCTGTGASLGVALEVVGDPAKGPMLQVVDLNDAAAPAVLGPTVGAPQTLSLTFQGGMLRVSWGNQNDTLVLATSLSAQKSCTLSVGAVATAPVNGQFTADIVRACFDL